jgi:ubiquinone/menaquinone biosynthesis C-methylase UbiE
MSVPARGRRRTQVRPVRALAAAVLRRLPALRQRGEKLLWRAVYELGTTGRSRATTVMNYGYAALEGPASPDSASDDRLGLQLYAEVARPGRLANKDVLEIGCGRGGGTAFVAEHFAPRSLVGLDLASGAIRGCTARHARPGLRFVRGDAERLPFAQATFDAVLSVESSHCYADVPAFLREVHRVLRPSGVLLIADFRHKVLPRDAEDALVPQEDVAMLLAQVGEAGFEITEQQDITPNIVRALHLDTPRRRERIERHVPRFARRHALAFAAVEGSEMYKAYAEGRWTYLRLVARRR